MKDFRFYKASLEQRLKGNATSEYAVYGESEYDTYGLAQPTSPDNESLYDAVYEPDQEKIKQLSDAKKEIEKLVGFNAQMSKDLKTSKAIIVDSTTTNTVLRNQIKEIEENLIFFPSK